MPILALLRKLLKTLNSEGTPAQIAAGIAIGAVMGLTPINSLHNLVLFGIALITRVSLAGVFLGWAIFIPVGFALDPLFHGIGEKLLLGTPALTPLWEKWFNTPFMALTNFNNTIVLGSFLGWLALSLPVFFLARAGVDRYRQHLYERVVNMKFVKAVKASKLFKFYRLLKPDLD
ncbi:TIGR03546 family protein [Gemmatimonadota bacterium]